MAVYADREHFIPLRRSDLVAHLCGQLSDDDARPFRRFCDLLCDRVHLEFYRLLERLKDDYAPFDPDADTKRLIDVPDAERAERIERLFNVFDRLLERGNFRKLTDREILDTQVGSSAWGIDMSVDLQAFSKFAMYVRGKSSGTRVLKSWRTWFRQKIVTVDIYKRLVLILKQCPHKRLGKDPDTRSVFLKVFKDIPIADLEMLIPGASLQMPKMERGKLGLSLVSGLVLLAWQLLKPVLLLAKAAAGGAVAYGPFGIIAALFGYGYRQYYGYQFSLKTYNLKLAQSLYYQNLDNNSGVIYRLLDAAEEQECREAILAYFYLWRFAGDRGVSEAELDNLVEAEIERTTGLKIDFEIDDAMRKLSRVGFCIRDGERYRALNIAEAIQRLADLPAEPLFAGEVLNDERTLGIAASGPNRDVRRAESVRTGPQSEEPGGFEHRSTALGRTGTD